MLLLKKKITGKTGNSDSKNAEIKISLKHLSNVRRILEILSNCVIKSSAVDQATKFAITDTKLDVPVVTLSIACNAKLLQQLKSRFKKAIQWNKYLSKVAAQALNQFGQMVECSFKN